eukprot:gene9869-20534_t
MSKLTIFSSKTILFVSAIASASMSVVSEETIISNQMRMKHSLDDRCTAIGVGPAATTDGSTITTHNNDCQECDIRITHVPAKDWPKGSKRPIFGERVAYPRYYELPGDNVHGPDYLYGTADSTIYNWTPSVPLGYIDQAEHTYGYTFGSYAIQNDKQLSMGESTCGSKFIALPVNMKGGKALFNMHALNEIALERCDTAVCAIKLMGDLGTKFGFYGPGGDSPDPEDAMGEAGEALIISDKTSTWMFHIAADDTGASCIWVAQRVPDGHITAVANQFVIGEIDLTDSTNFLASDNVFEVAIRNNLWRPASGKPFHFASIYGIDKLDQAPACTRRIWRIFTLAAPSLLPLFSPYTDTYGSFGYGTDGTQPYPFSVKPDKKLSVRDIMKMTRDYYEGTQFDQTTGSDSGPFGDPMRFMPMGPWEDATNGVDWKKYSQGLGYPRVISLWRTAYATVTQSRATLPDEVGAVTWVAQNNPHTSVFVPVYAAAAKTPSSLNCGTQYKLDRNSNYWTHSVVSNYLARWYRYTIEDIHLLQAKLELKMLGDQANTEASAVELMAGEKTPTATLTYLSLYQERVATSTRDVWWDFFWVMTGKYRDMYKVTFPHTENFLTAARYMTVPKWWLEQIGYWGAPGTPPAGELPIGIKPINIPGERSMDDYKKLYPNGIGKPYASSIPGLTVSMSAPTASPVTMWTSTSTSSGTGTTSSGHGIYNNNMNGYQQQQSQSQHAYGNSYIDTTSSSSTSSSTATTGIKSTTTTTGTSSGRITPSGSSSPTTTSTSTVNGGVSLLMLLMGTCMGVATTLMYQRLKRLRTSSTSMSYVAVN